MSAVLGTSVGVFVGVTLVLAGGAAYMTGQALASHWRRWWQVVFYIALLGFGDRFVTFALFGGELFSFTGYLIDTAVLLAYGGFAYRLTRARQMVRQYPWLYEPSGLLGWRERSPDRSTDTTASTGDDP